MTSRLRIAVVLGNATPIRFQRPSDPRPTKASCRLTVHTRSFQIQQNAAFIMNVVKRAFNFLIRVLLQNSAAVWWLSRSNRRATDDTERRGMGTNTVDTVLGATGTTIMALLGSFYRVSKSKMYALPVG